MARDRHLHHVKAFRPTLGKGIPQPNEGTNGDFAIRHTKDGLFLFLKSGNLWYKISGLEPVPTAKKFKTTSANNETANNIHPGKGVKTGKATLGVAKDQKLALTVRTGEKGVTTDGGAYIRAGDQNSARTSASGLSQDSYFVQHSVNDEMLLELKEKVNNYSYNISGLNRNAIYLINNLIVRGYSLDYRTLGQVELDLMASTYHEARMRLWNGASLKWNIGNDPDDNKLKIAIDHKLGNSSVLAVDDLTPSYIGGAWQANQTTPTLLYQSSTNGAGNGLYMYVTTDSGGNPTFTFEGGGFGRNGWGYVIDEQVIFEDPGSTSYTAILVVASIGNSTLYEFSRTGTLQINNSTDPRDYCKIDVAASGATTISTVDADAAAAHLTLDADGEITLDAVGDIHLNITGGDVKITDPSGIAEPRLTLKGENLGYTSSPQLMFDCVHSGGESAADTLGYIGFQGRDSGGGTTTYASIAGIIADPSAGSEGGQLRFQIASHDAELVNGLLLEDGNAEDEVDVTIGNGTASQTTIAGVLGITGSTISGAGNLEINSVGHFTIDVATSKEISLAENGSTYTPTSGNHAVPKHYMDANVYHFLRIGFYSSSTGQIFLPVPGNEDGRDVTSSASFSEKLVFICPYDGSFEKALIRSEAVCGSSILGFHHTASNIEVPSPTAAQTVTVDMAVDDTSYEFDFAAVGTNTFSKGDILMFSFDPTNAPYDIHFMIVLKFDVST